MHLCIRRTCKLQTNPAVVRSFRQGFRHIIHLQDLVGIQTTPVHLDLLGRVPLAITDRATTSGLMQPESW